MSAFSVVPSMKNGVLKKLDPIRHYHTKNKHSCSTGRTSQSFVLIAEDTVPRSSVTVDYHKHVQPKDHKINERPDAP